MEEAGFPVGSLLWTPDGPCPIERLQQGATVLSLDPATFRRRPTRVELLRPCRLEGATRLMAGGRLLLVDPESRILCYDRQGQRGMEPAGTVVPGQWLAVDRRVPLTADATQLPAVDPTLDARLGETESAAGPEGYAAARRRAGARERLFELLGFLLGVTEWVEGTIQLAPLDPEGQRLYAPAFERLFEHPLTAAAFRDEPALRGRLARWLDTALAPLPARRWPDWIWTLAAPPRAALLRGFFDGQGEVGRQAVTLSGRGIRLMVDLQALLGTLGVEARLEPDGEDERLRLEIRNVRRFAEWIGSRRPGRHALLEAIFRLEPRYPGDGTARLPAAQVEPVLARLQGERPSPSHAAPAAPESTPVEVGTLRLLATAFGEPGLRALVNQRIYLEPVHDSRSVPGGEGRRLRLRDGVAIVNGIAAAG